MHLSSRSRTVPLVTASLLLLGACGSPSTEPVVATEPADEPTPADEPATDEPAADEPTADEPPAAPTAGSAAAPSEAEARMFGNHSNAFGFDLYARLRTRTGNQIVSPASIAVALDMTYGGARGETAAEMARVLHVPGGEEIHTAAGRVLASWNDPARDAYTLAVANRLFGEATYTFEPAYLGLTRDRYGAPLEGVDFRGAPQPARVHINEWVATQTRDRIRDLIPAPGITTDTRLVLVNAVYFLARWAEAFEGSATRDREFFVDGSRSAIAPTMHRGDAMSYGEVEGVQLLELPYRGGDVAMLIALPRDRAGLAAMEASLDAGRFERWVGALQPGTQVMLALPRFRIAPAESIPLATVLREMGMPLAFTRGSADFTGIANPPSVDDRLFISQVFHKGFVQVDEEGTEAAAATAVVMARGGGGPPPAMTEFRADHPFLFFIRDLRSGTILFIGRLTDPT